MEAENTIRWLEPIFGSHWYFRHDFNDEAENLRDELTTVFGKQGGIIMDFACGEMTLNQYMMKCDICGKSDYHIEYLKRIIDVFSRFAEEYGNDTRQVGRSISEGWGAMFRARLRRLKEETRKLNQKWIDNF